MLYPHPAKTFDLSLSFHPQRNCNWFSTGRTFELRNVWRKVPKADVTLGTFRLRNVSLHLDVDAVSQETPSDCAYGHANWTKTAPKRAPAPAPFQPTGILPTSAFAIFCTAKRSLILCGSKIM